MTLPQRAAHILDLVAEQVVALPSLREKLTTRRGPLSRLVQTMLQRAWTEHRGLTAAQSRAFPLPVAQLRLDLQRMHGGPAPPDDELLTAYDRGYLQGLDLHQVRAVRLPLELSRRGESRDAVAILWQAGQAGDWTARLDGWLAGRPQGPRLVQVLAQVAQELERTQVRPLELGERLVLDHRRRGGVR